MTITYFRILGCSVVPVPTLLVLDLPRSWHFTLFVNTDEYILKAKNPGYASYGSETRHLLA